MLSEEMKEKYNYYIKNGWSEFNRHEYTNIIEKVEQLEQQNKELIDFLKKIFYNIDICYNKIAVYKVADIKYILKNTKEMLKQKMGGYYK